MLFLYQEEFRKEKLFLNKTSQLDLMNPLNILKKKRSSKYIKQFISVSG